MVARDIEQPAVMDLNTAYASISGTTKHIGTSFVTPESVQQTLKLLHEIAGGEKNGATARF